MHLFSGPFEMAAGPLPVNKAIELEARLRAHPIAKHQQSVDGGCPRKPKE